MIQEISGYLLIRNFFAIQHSNDQISYENTEKGYEEFHYTLDNVIEILEREDYFLFSKEVQEDLLTLINKHRFLFKDKKTIDKINFIIGKINQYRSMNHDEYVKKTEEWYINEFKDRNLVYDPKDPDEALRFCAIDFTMYDQLTSNDMSIEYLFEKTQLDNYLYTNLFLMCSTMNLIMNRCPKFMIENIDMDELYNVFNNHIAKKLDIFSMIYYKVSINDVRYLKETNAAMKRFIQEHKEEITQAKQRRKEIAEIIRFELEQQGYIDEQSQEELNLLNIEQANQEKRNEENKKKTMFKKLS